MTKQTPTPEKCYCGYCEKCLGLEAHTATPWQYDWLDDDNGWILDARGRYLFTVVASDTEGRFASIPEQKANTAFAVTACNSHDELVKILQAISVNYEEYLLPNVKEEIRQALSKAGA